MLFSDPAIADFINDRFEPSWQSVREVPVINIDFGGGVQLTRTLHGNIATYICLPDGTVVDVLPGIYDRATYLQELSAAWEFVNTLAQTSAGDDIPARIRSYHVSRLARWEASDAAPRPADALPREERPRVSTEAALTGSRWRASLEADTRQNERHRRTAIHRKLSAGQPVLPNDISKWLYREVLHADLDDPYLGLGDALFANYPFNDRR